MNNTTPFTIEELAEASRYPVIVEWSDEDGVYLAWAPGLRGTTVHGDTPTQALEKSIEAVANWIYGMRKVGQPIPAPNPMPVGR
jgi:predicted RNase H-like HicB family nuclease